MANSQIDSPIPLSDIESVLAWVDTFKLSRVTKKINRDFSDAVLLAEILYAHYPKLVEMHNYPPRNSHSLKLNNWMTLNRKVLKKLKLGLCCNTMEQLADSTPGVIERVLVMVRDKIRRDEEANKTLKEEGMNMSSGGSYYEACGEEDHVLVVPVKTRVNGVLETLQQKVVSYESYCTLKEELKDAKDAAEVLKQKVEHLDNLIKLKDERIDELQSQLERKQARRKEVETQQSMLNVPYESAPSPHIIMDNYIPAIKTPSLKTVTSNCRVEESKINYSDSKTIIDNNDIKMPIIKDTVKIISKHCLNDIVEVDVDTVKSDHSLEKVKSEVFKEVDDDTKLYRKKSDHSCPDSEIYIDSEQGGMMTIEVTIQNEIKELMKTPELMQDLNNFTL